MCDEAEKPTPCSGDAANGAVPHRPLKKVLPTGLHPLHPLTADEIRVARDAVVNHMAEAHDVTKPRFSYITLHEPNCMGPIDADREDQDDGDSRQNKVDSDLEKARVAEIVVHLPPTVPYMVRVRLGGCGGACVVSDHVLSRHTQPVLTPDDCELAERIVRQDQSVASLIRKHYGLTELDSRLVCDPWSVHMADNPLPADYDAWANDEDGPDEQARNGDSNLSAVRGAAPRLVQTFLYYKLSGSGDEHNHYAHPLHLVPLVDLAARRVIVVDGHSRKHPPPLPQAAVNYFDEALKHNAYLARDVSPHGLRPLDVVQPEGASFQLNGPSLSWYKWTLRIGFNYREGVVLHDVRYDGRPILRRASVVEMAVPYADANPPFHRKCAFDVGDYGLGYCAQSLSLGCDCLGCIAYLDATLADTSGEPYVIKRAVCIHEEDAGVLHKHVEYRTGTGFTRRARKLVVSFVATVVNYEYLFYWWLHVDGSIGLDIRLSGELSTNTLSEGETGTSDDHDVPDYGTLVAPAVNAQMHQHMFCARLEPTIDGPCNRISEIDVVPADSSVGFGNAFNTRHTLLQSERNATRDVAIGRTWRIANASVTNPIARKHVGYRLVPTAATPALLTSHDSTVSKRARFAQHALWVTQWRENERYAAGEFPTQGLGDDGSDVANRGDDGVWKWVERDAPIVDKQLVIWHSFGVMHVPRTEDFPIMPCETTGFVLKPDCFFTGNPTIGMEHIEAKKSVCCN